MRLLISAPATAKPSTAQPFVPPRPPPSGRTGFYDFRALTTVTPATKANRSVQTAGVLAISSVVLAVVIVATLALGTTLFGVPTSYGNGIDSSLAAKVKTDFLADQDAEAKALTNGDQSLLGGNLSDSALGDVIQQIADQSKSGVPPEVAFQPASLSILRAPDPADPSLTIEVQEDGTKSVVTSNGPDAAPTEQTISFQGDFWMRNSTGSHFTIADQQIQTLPSSPLPAIAVVVAALLVVGLGALLVVRRRSLRPALEQAASAQPALAAAARIELPAAREAALPVGPPPGVVVTTFGGLHVRQGGTDWAQALTSRSVTGFVWLRLLVAAVRNPNSQVARDEIGRQASPRLSRDVQLKRVRNVIAKGLREMPPVLRDRILVTSEAMSFRLDGCEVDAIELVAMSAATAGRREITSTEAARVQRLLAACQGTFLPEFEAIEDLATDRHPTCTELVRELRESLTNKRVELALMLADTLLLGGQPSRAIAALEPTLDDRPERKDIADRLAAAYRGAGREAEALALERKYA